MSVIYDLEHITTYRYRNPVTFGKHRAIFLPGTGFSERILSYSLETNVPSKIRWIMDTLSCLASGLSSRRGLAKL